MKKDNQRARIIHYLEQRGIQPTELAIKAEMKRIEDERKKGDSK